MHMFVDIIKKHL